MKLVQIVKLALVNTPVDMLDRPAGPLFEVVASDFATVAEALESISSGDHGNGPFDIISVNRRGVKLQPVTELVMDAGEVFGPKVGKPTGAAARAGKPAADKKDNGKKDAAKPPASK